MAVAPDPPDPASTRPEAGEAVMPDEAAGFSDAGRGIGSDGHRQRLRDRFEQAGPEGLAD